MSTTTVDAAFESDLRELIEANRTRALWWLPRDFFPTTDEQARRVLERIAARGDRDTFVCARQLLQRLP